MNSSCGHAAGGPTEGSLVICVECLKVSQIVKSGLLLKLIPIQEADLNPETRRLLEISRSVFAQARPQSDSSVAAAVALALTGPGPLGIPAVDTGDAPLFWKHETTGIMFQIVQKYLAGAPLPPPEIEIMRQYFEQWVTSPLVCWTFVDLEAEMAAIKESIRHAKTVQALRQWQSAALKIGIDPL